MDAGTLRLVIFSFILSILFPMFAFTFTTFGSDPGSFDSTLSASQLENAGIRLSDAESHNITFGDPAQAYTVKNQTMRIKWVNSILFPDYFANQQQSWVEKFFNTWFFPVEMSWAVDGSSGFLPSSELTNASVINNFDTEYNWTKYWCIENGLYVFMTPLPADNNSMAISIQNGTVTMTVASQVMDSNNVNALNFVNWYIGIVTGQGDWGLPAFMVWVVRIFSFMTLLAGYLLTTELIPG